MSSFTDAFADALAAQYEAFGKAAVWTQAGVPVDPAPTVILDTDHEDLRVPAGLPGGTRQVRRVAYVRASEVAAPKRGDRVTIAALSLTLELSSAPEHVDGDGMEWRCPAVKV